MVALMRIGNKNKVMIGVGIASIFSGLMAPWIIQTELFGVKELAENSINTGSVQNLLLAAVRLVAMNTIRSMPIYIGVLLLAEGLGFFSKIKKTWLLVAVLVIVPGIYQSIYFFHGVAYDFGVPAIAMTLVTLIVSRMKNLARNVVHKLMVVALLLFGVEWLDIVPMLTPYRFGGGVLSLYVKQIADLNYITDLLNVIGMSLFVILVSNAFILARLLNVYTLEIKAIEQELEYEQLSNQIALQAMENRAFREMQSLVHDLKTPLTSIQGLAGVIAISQEHTEIKKHASYISSLVDKMSIMINELLRDDSRQVIFLKELVEYALAHVPALAKLSQFEFVTVQEVYVRANKIKVARAIINVLENAMAAVDLKHGRICITVERKNEFAAIVIADNGQGFIGDFEKNVWKSGYSVKNSSGLGLPFVRDIIEKHSGLIEISNNPSGGAKVVILLPEVHMSE